MATAIWNSSQIAGFTTSNSEATAETTMWRSTSASETLAEEDSRNRLRWRRRMEGKLDAAGG